MPLSTSGENDDNGISINQNAFALNGAVITDRADNLADNISHARVPDNESFKVDTIPPAVNSFTMDDVDVRIGDRPIVTLEFSEPISPEDTDSCDILALTYDDISVPNGVLTVSYTHLTLPTTPYV